jgi:hypothetical protein
VYSHHQWDELRRDYLRRLERVRLCQYLRHVRTGANTSADHEGH